MKNTSRQSGATPPPRIFLSAGEVSGDLHAAHLAAALLRACPSAQLHGCGGSQMSAAGVDVRIQTAHLGYLGFSESLPLRRFVHEARERTAELLRTDPPDLVILVDGERFNLPLIRLLRELGIPFVYYFVPLVWFWARWRARRVARQARLVIPAFPQERDIFLKEGANAEWFGHPLVDMVSPEEDREAIVAAAGIERTKALIGLMPGSREQEVRSFTPRLLDAAKQILARRPGLRFVMPIASERLLSRMSTSVAEAGLSDHVHLVTSNRYAFLSRCEVVLMASGTATLEVALLGVPMVVFYQVHPLTYLAARALIRTRYVSLPNILLQQAVVPELIQGDFTAARLAEEAMALLTSRDRAGAVREQLKLIRPMLGAPGAADRAARRILEELGVSSRFAPVKESETPAVAS